MGEGQPNINTYTKPLSALQKYAGLFPLFGHVILDQVWTIKLVSLKASAFTANIQLQWQL